MPDWKRHTRGATLLYAIALLALARRTAAEERVHFEVLPDEALHELTLQRKEMPAEPTRVEIFGGLEASTLRGIGGGPWRPFSAHAGLGAGFWASPLWSVALRSETAVPLPLLASDGAHGPLALRDVEGSHRLRGTVGLGEIREGESGATIDIDASLAHAGPYSTSYLRRDIGPYPFWDAAGKISLEPRHAFDRDAAMVMPLSLSLRHAAALRPEGEASFQTVRGASGIGVHPFTSESSHGWFEIAGASIERTRFDAAPGAPRPRLGGVDRLDLRFLHLDGMLVAPEHDFVVDMSFLLGGSWLWDNTTKQDASTFLFKASVGFHGYLGNDHPDDRVGAGVAVERGAGFLADGSALTRRWRVELFADADVLDHHAGGSVRGAMEQLSFPNAPEETRDAGFRHLFASEWYFGFARVIQMGFHHASTNQCMGAAPAGDPRWCHQLGIFVRLRERWVKETPEPPPRAPPEPPPPPLDPPDPRGVIVD
jgi:hypothetical protein